MIEFVLEIVFELLFQFVFEVVVEFIGRGVAGAASNRGVRVALNNLFVAACGFAGGVWWGARLSDVRTAPPKLLFVSICLATVFAVLAVLRSGDETATGYHSPFTIRFGEPPWRKGYWSTTRLTTFAIVNAAVAVGIATSFTPYQPG